MKLANIARVCFAASALALCAGCGEGSASSRGSGGGGFGGQAGDAAGGASGATSTGGVAGLAGSSGGGQGGVGGDDAGSNDTWGEHMGVSLWPSKENFDRVHDLGLGWVRISWELGWGPFDTTLIPYAHALGLKVLQVCQKSPHGYADSDVAPMADYCAGWVDAGVDAIELGNEWNHAQFYCFASQCPDATYASQAKLVDAMVAAIRKKSSAIPVISSGWSPESSPNDPKSAMAKLLDQAKVFVAQGTAIGHHPYCYDCDSPLTCGVPNNPEWNAFLQTRDVHQAAVARGFARPVWFTEIGGPSGNGQSAFGKPYTLETQKQLYLDYVTGIGELRSEGIPVERVFWHTIQDGQSSTNAVEETFGLYDAAWQLKPAGQVVKELAAMPW